MMTDLPWSFGTRFMDLCEPPPPAAIINQAPLRLQFIFFLIISEIAAQHMMTDLPSSFGTSFMDLCGYSMAKEAARK